MSLLPNYFKKLIPPLSGGEQLEINSFSVLSFPLSEAQFCEIDSELVNEIKNAGGKASIWDGAKLPYPDSQFNRVVIINSGCWVNENVLRDIYRVLNNTGQFIVRLKINPQRIQLLDEILESKRYDVSYILDLIDRCGFRIQHAYCRKMRRNIIPNSLQQLYFDYFNEISKLKLIKGSEKYYPKYFDWKKADSIYLSSPTLFKQYDELFLFLSGKID